MKRIFLLILTTLLAVSCSDKQEEEVAPERRSFSMSFTPWPYEATINAQGIVWFSAYDFDKLWSDILNDNLSLVWRDTGLKDGNQVARKSLTNWQTWLSFSQQ